MIGMSQKMRRAALFVGTLGLLFPLLAVADSSVPGGFPSGSIWLSKTILTQGDSVEIYTPVYDGTGDLISGNVVFLVDNTSIGSVQFNLADGDSQIANLSWSAIQGTHAITATIQNAIDNSTKEPIALSGEQTQEIDVSVAPAPPQPAIVQALNTVGGVAQNTIIESEPIVIQAANAVHDETETLRTAAQSALENSLSGGSGAEVTATSTGKVLGAHTYRAPGTLAAVASAPSSFSALRILEEIALFIVSYQWVFYPLLILLVLLIIYLFAKWVSRPRQRT